MLKLKLRMIESINGETIWLNEEENALDERPTTVDFLILSIIEDVFYTASCISVRVIVTVRNEQPSGIKIIRYCKLLFFSRII